MTKIFDKDTLKKSFCSFATGVCVATSHSGGFTVNSFSSLSLEPPLMIFNIYKTETDHISFFYDRLSLIVFFGYINLVIFWCIKSDNGQNKYGPESSLIR